MFHISRFYLNQLNPECQSMVCYGCERLTSLMALVANSMLLDANWVCGAEFIWPPVGRDDANLKSYWGRRNSATDAMSIFDWCYIIHFRLCWFFCSLTINLTQEINSVWWNVDLLWKSRDYVNGISRHNIETFNINIISRNNTLEILGITRDEKFNFNEHIRDICQTSSRQINALRRISKFS